MKIKAPTCEQCRAWGGMTRIYWRGEKGKGYTPIGWVCTNGHVKMDRDSRATR